MNYKILNSILAVKISSRGGELRSMCDSDGQEYIWQGDKEIWEDRAPNLFPYIGRMTEKSYQFQGKRYHMDIHGFLPTSEMELVSKTKESLTLKLDASEETLIQYPFLFSLEITWTLVGERLEIAYQVKNKDEKTMYFGIGGHPGFIVPVDQGFLFSLEITWTLVGERLEIAYQVKNKDEKTMYFGIGGHPGFIVPVDQGAEFEDYRIDFGVNASPKRVKMSEDCFVLEGDEFLELTEKRYLNLRHDLFDHDAIILKKVPREVKLNSEKGDREIVISFPDMDYLGIWHRPLKTPNYVDMDYLGIWHRPLKTPNYVCIEPWSSLPSRKDIVEDIAQQPGLIALESGGVYRNSWSILIRQ